MALITPLKTQWRASGPAVEHGTDADFGVFRVSGSCRRDFVFYCNMVFKFKHTLYVLITPCFRVLAHEIGFKDESGSHDPVVLMLSG